MSNHTPLSATYYDTVRSRRLRIQARISARRRIAPGLYTMHDAEGRRWDINKRRIHDDYGGGIGWVAYCNDDRGLYMDPAATLREASYAVAYEPEMVSA